MKIGCFGDVHWTDRKPVNRTDEDFLLTLEEKLIWAYTGPFNLCSAVTMPGDVYDTSKANDFLKQSLISLLLGFPMPTYAIYGQHDLRFHNSNKLNTPLRVMEAANAVTILGKDPVPHSPKVHLYGASWGEEVPEIHDKTVCNILVIHKMILKDEKLWDGQTDYSMGRVLLRKHKFDLIVSGDNHQSFTDSFSGRHLLNMGSLARTNISQLEHKPSVAVYDTKTRNFQIFEIPVSPAEEVFKVEKALAEKEKSKQLEAFIEGLRESSPTEGLDFKNNLQTRMQNGQIPEEVIAILKEATDGIN